MHEFSLAQGLHDQVMDLVRENKVEKVIEIEICVGDNAGIVVESFLFGFNVIAGQNTATKDAELVVNTDDGKDLMLMKLELS
ncbi:MAG: hydrogenase/urease maturation nickel metallochaperone HypA [Desulfotalea sp.]